MIIRCPNLTDWETFSALAVAENWRVPRSESGLFQGSWSEHAYVLEDDGFCGLVTAVAYEKSAWIGNLLVPHHRRGKGYGTHLFKAVFAGLVEQGMTSIWLTASDQGRGIYEREGFTVVDSVERWVLPSQRGSLGQKATTHHPDEGLLHADALVWGENRKSLLSELCNIGKIFSAGGAIALLQQGQDFQVLGPWYSHGADPSANQELLQRIVASRDPAVEIVIDYLTSSQIQPFCKTVGFQYSGQSVMMVYGDAKGVRLKNLVSLASLGSIG